MATAYFLRNQNSASLPFGGPKSGSTGRAISATSDEFEHTLLKLNRIINDWAGFAVVVNYHVSTNSWIFIALHNTTLGPATGGCRLQSYPTPVDGLRDAVRLAEGMTHKWAILNAARGGGKVVICISGELAESDRITLLHLAGQTIEDLNGALVTAGDLGITPSDLNTMSTVTQYVRCFDRGTGRQIDSGAYTALGVAAGMRSMLQAAFGENRISGRTVLVQGVGQVGQHLVRLLVMGGARVLINDINQGLLSQLRNELDCEIVAEDRVYDAECDIYAPCALGGTLNSKSIFQLRCKIVAGAANNQLADYFVADEMHELGILYAPDYVINAGGAIAVPMFYDGAGHDEVRARVVGVGDTLSAILKEARDLDESPFHSARRMSESILRNARGSADENQLRCLGARAEFALSKLTTGQV